MAANAKVKIATRSMVGIRTSFESLFRKIKMSTKRIIGRKVATNISLKSKNVRTTTTANNREWKTISDFLIKEFCIYPNFLFNASCTIGGTKLLTSPCSDATFRITVELR